MSKQRETVTLGEILPGCPEAAAHLPVPNSPEEMPEAFRAVSSLPREVGAEVARLMATQILEMLAEESAIGPLH